MYFCENVYLVSGKTCAAIYDLNHGNLYHLNPESRELLSIIGDKRTFTQEEMAFLLELKRMGILTEEKVEPHAICDLANKADIDFVWIEVTTLCNLRCVHCYDNSSPTAHCTMNIIDFKHIVDELVDVGIKRIQLIGGEPFVLGEKLKEYFDYCLGKFDYIEVYSNGTLIDEKWYDYLSTNKIHVAISVYSYVEDEHNRITQNTNSYALTNHAIRELYSHGIQYRVKNVLMANLELGKKNTELYTLSYSHDVVRLAGRANLELIDDKLLRLKLITPETFKRRLSKQMVHRLVSGHNCFSRRLYFAANLQIYPCVMERRVSHGSIKNKSLRSLIDEGIRSYNKDKIEGCCQCEFRYCCFDCRPDSGGRAFNSKPWYCTYNPDMGQWDDPDDFIEKLHFSKSTSP